MKNLFTKYLTHVRNFEERHDIGRYILSRVRLDNCSNEEDDDDEVWPLGPISLCFYIVGIGSFIYSICFLSIFLF